MPLNENLIKSVKKHLGEQPSDELRLMLEKRDLGTYSEEAFVAAQEVLDARARGEGKEPPPKAPELTAIQLAAIAEGTLKRQVRLVGFYFYLQAIVWFLVSCTLISLTGRYSLVEVTVLAIPPTFFTLLGWSVRRFKPISWTPAVLCSVLLLPAFPLGTILGLYIFDKLTKGQHLFEHSSQPK